MAGYVAKRQASSSQIGASDGSSLALLSAILPASQEPTITDGGAAATTFFDFPESALTESPSMVETVILIAPSGTVGGSIIITSVPVLPTLSSLQFSTPGPMLSSLAFGDTTQMSVSLPTIIMPSVSSAATQTFTDSTIPSSMALSSISTVADPSSTSTRSSITTSMSSSSSTRTQSTSSSTTSITTQPMTTFTDAQHTKSSSGLGAGSVAAIVISMIGLAVLIGLALLYVCRRRRHRRPASPQVYPEEAYLYDPPIIPSQNYGPIETTEYRRAGDTGSVYGVQGEALIPAGLARPRTPTRSSSSEREGLLDRARRGSRPRTASSSIIRQPPIAHRDIPYMLSGLSPIGPSGYQPAPTDEGDLADQGPHFQQNPFSDPPDTSYDGGTMVTHDLDDGGHTYVKPLI